MAIPGGNRMNIVVVSEYFYPDNFGINNIVEELVKAGHHVQVLTGLPDYTTFRIPKEYKWFRKRREDFHGASIIRVPTIARRHGVFFRALSYGSFIISSYLYACFCSKTDIDAIFVYQTSPVFQGIPARKLKKRTGKKLVLYCCDLWPESLKAWNVKEKSLLFRMVRRMSEKIYQSCDTIAISSKPFRNYLKEVCGVQEQCITYLPQHAEDLYRDVCGKYEENGQIDFLFAGNVGAVQNIDCIIRAIPYVRTKAPFQVHIVGDGSELEACKQLAQQLHVTDRVRFYGRYPQSEMKRFYQMADCFLLTLRGGDFIGLTLPAKSQSYLSAGKPIVAAIDGAGREVIQEADCGECVPAGDYLGLGESMTQVVEHFDRYRQKGRNGRKFYEENYTREKFMESLKKLLAG